MKKIIIVLIIIALGWGLYYLSQNKSDTVKAPDTTLDADKDTNTASSTTDVALDTNKEQTVLGKSVEGRDIVAYHFGTGEKELLFVGGIHGAYSYNTALVAEELVKDIKSGSLVVPDGLKVTVVPLLNPDGYEKVKGSAEGRFNANTVDLNRNFDCDWQTKGVWQSKSVSGGTNAFSEPESQAIKTYIEGSKPAGVVVWYSSAGGVFSSSCHNGVLPETSAMTKEFSKASGYPAHESFNYYEITGDMVNWLAKEKIPAISVLLTNHTDAEWNKNKLGIEALLKYFSK